MNQKLRIITSEFIKNLKDYFWFILFALIYLLYFLIFHEHGPNCLVKWIFGIPCPGCGMTRALISLVQFQFATAFMFHPLIFIMPTILVVFFFKGLPKISRLYHSKVFWGIIIALFLSVYTLRMFAYFPDTIPMDYFNHSLLEIFIT